MFVANGLLVSSSSSQVHHLKDVGPPLPTKLKFVSNGLLSTSGTTEISNEEQPSHDTERQVPPASMLIGSLMPQLAYLDSTASKNLSFVMNGLLSSHPSNPDVGQFIYFHKNDCLCLANALAVLPRADSPDATNPNTQINAESLSDDDLPPISEAFALPSRLISRPNASTTIPHIPRVTVRATTNDGKTIYLRKRKKLSPSELTVSQSCIERPCNNLTYNDVLRLHQVKGSVICLEFLFTDSWMGCQLPLQKSCNARAYYDNVNSQLDIKMTF